MAIACRHRYRPHMVLLDRIDAVLIDMNGTFMFGQDRFGPQEQYHETYCGEGGQALGPTDMRQAVDAVLAAMAALYNDPDRFDAYPSVADVISALPETRALPSRERDLIETVVAVHERGQVPKSHAAALRQLSTLRPLVLVSNIWSAAGPWRAALARDGLIDLFAATVFSSEQDCIKPATRIYTIARDAVGVPFDRILFIGDDPVLDVAAPRRLGMITAQVGPALSHKADMTAADLPALVARWL